ncbi:ROK family protein [Micromonospora echinofusca]|uniref:ROK family protein n=1 Tax=Micromonospora echinofusca TaxID=47858 RepID=A0ABS3VLS2_MICEH|nr:ROK family protein [Micromonospora echinofusca]MBO4205487.1 ROK family protein [Micromonospora echinofusca]
MRTHNLALVLRHIADAPHPPSRAEVATTTGLTRATVSALVDDLLAGHLLAEVSPAPRTGAGRPAQGLVLADHGPAGLGLEINVDYLATCLIDLTGTVRHHAVHRIDLRTVSPTTALTRIADLAVAARTEAAHQGLTVAGTVLAVPGLVSGAGLVRLAPNLGWRDVDVPAVLAGHPGIDSPAGASLVVENEANLAALGELHAAPAGPRSFVHISGEIGIGAGIVLDGALFRGARGFSGEIGHLAVEPGGRPCRCGARGCLEPYAGLEAIMAGAGLGRTDLPAGAAVARLTRLAEAGDPATCRALAEAGTALGVTVAGVVNLLDIETVILGGAYAPLTRWLRPPVEAEITGRVLTATWSPVTVRAALLGADAAVVGAAGSVVRRVVEEPADWLAGTA